MARSQTDTTQKFERAIKSRRKYVLVLYVASMNARARFAIDNIRKICEEHLKGRCRLKVVDIRKDPSLAAREDIVATPVLMKKLPPPLRSFIGNMEDIDRVLVGLEITQKETEEK